MGNKTPSQSVSIDFFHSVSPHFLTEGKKKNKSKLKLLVLLKRINTKGELVQE